MFILNAVRLCRKSALRYLVMIDHMPANKTLSSWLLQRLTWNKTWRSYVDGDRSVLLTANVHVMRRQFTRPRGCRYVYHWWVLMDAQVESRLSICWVFIYLSCR